MGAIKKKINKRKNNNNNRAYGSILGFNPAPVARTRLTYSAVL